MPVELMENALRLPQLHRHDDGDEAVHNAGISRRRNFYWR
jgi:hypothetical protein